MITILYFSPTGNVRLLAEKLSSQFDSGSVKLLPLEFTNPEDLKESGHIVIMFSIHAFNPPQTVKRFIKNMPEGLCEQVTLISVGCADSWINRAATSGLRKTLLKKEYSILVDELLAMPLTIVMSFPEELKRKLLVTAEKKIQHIGESIVSSSTLEQTIPIKSKILSFIGKAEGPAARLFGLELHAGNDCTSCGLCVENCPEGNIKFNKKNKPKFRLHCLMCMRCIYNCPENTIKPRFSKFIPIKNGYSVDLKG